MNNDHQIPEQVSRAILASREKFHEMNKKAQAANAELRKNKSSPIIEIGFITKPLTLDKELQFWKIDDDDELEDFLFGDLLAGMHFNSEISWEELPPGYAPLITVLEFERHCRFEGWTAIDNKGVEEMPGIIECYKLIGLPDEAKALTCVFQAYQDLGDPDHEEFHSIMSKAYRSIPNKTPNEEDRIPIILNFVRRNPELFYRPQP